MKNDIIRLAVACGFYSLGFYLMDMNVFVELTAGLAIIAGCTVQNKKEEI